MTMTEEDDVEEDADHYVFKFGVHGRLSNARASVNCVRWYRFLRFVQQACSKTPKMFEVSVGTFLAASSLGETHIPTWKFKFPLGNAFGISMWRTAFPSA